MLLSPSQFDPSFKSHAKQDTVSEADMIVPDALPLNSLLQPAGETNAVEPATVEGSAAVSIRMTVEGVYFLVLMLSLLLIGVNYGKPLIVVFTLFACHVAGLSLWYSWRHVRKLKVFLLTQPDLFVGKTVPLLIGIHDYCGGFSRDRTLEIRLAGEEQSDDVALVNGLGQWAILYAPTKRGEVDLGPVQIRCHYPFALFQSTLTTALPTQCVYPAPSKPSTPRAKAKFEVTRDADDTLVGLRPYQQGDMVSRIHWSLFQQNRSLMVKTEEAMPVPAKNMHKDLPKDLPKDNAAAGDTDAAEPLWVDWADYSNLEPERRLSQMTYSVLKASRQGLTFGLRLPEKQIEVAAGKGHRARCLRTLAMA
ncbi:MAG: DUF58 domain-containing protein [Gammaproteobacteria bacterium]|nr:DUF58 domain-containing protein [Gammaproteobacteria bacterium]MDH5801906.1 DUF58 domain-containing protein [Gammaproteobacteria bacterium]